MIKRDLTSTKLLADRIKALYTVNPPGVAYQTALVLLDQHFDTVAIAAFEYALKDLGAGIRLAMKDQRDAFVESLKHKES